MKQSTKHLRTLLCTVLCLCLVLAMSGAMVAAQPNGKAVDAPATAVVKDSNGEEVTYELVAQNGGYAMYADMSGGYFYLENLATGKKWHSTVQDANDEGNYTGGLNRTTAQSQLLLEYVDRSIEIFTEHPEKTNSYLECVESSTGGGTTVTKLDNGIRVDYYFGSVLNITIPVTYTLEDGYLEASVLNGEGKDGIQDAPFGTTEGFAVASLRVLPAFGAGNWEDEGYLLLPDGSGTLIHFNNQKTMATEYREPIYGANKLVSPESVSTKLETLRVPVFGTRNGEEALMGIITEGDAVADITFMSGNATCAYNAVSSIYNYRSLSTQYNMYNKRRVAILTDVATDLEAYRVRYYPLSGEDATYIGMANKYREYLIAEKGFKKRDTAPSLHVDFQGMYETPASILGVIPYTKQVPLTTYAQAQTIVEDLRAAGITSISATYTGWSNNGLTNVKIPKAATPLSVLGKAKGFNALQTSMTEFGYGFAPSTDLLSFQKSGNGVAENKHAIRSHFDKVIKQQQYMLSVYITKLGGTKTAHLSSDKLVDVADRYLVSMNKLGLKEIDLGNIGDYCYSNDYTKNTITRTQFTEDIVKVLKKYDEAGIKVTVSGGNAYVLPYVDVVTDVPTHSSGYDLFDEDVPFFQAILHGYVPYTTVSVPQSGNPEFTYLSAVESGTELNYIGIYEDAGELFDTPYNHLYSSTWTLWKDAAAEQYKAYQPLLESVKDKTMKNHYCAAERVYVTQYEGGVTVAVNYTAQPVTVDGHEVPATGFVTWEVTA